MPVILQVPESDKYIVSTSLVVKKKKKKQQKNKAKQTLTVIIPLQTYSTKHISQLDLLKIEKKKKWGGVRGGG